MVLLSNNCLVGALASMRQFCYVVLLDLLKRFIHNMSTGW